MKILEKLNDPMVFFPLLLLQVGLLSLLWWRMKRLEKKKKLEAQAQLMNEYED